MFLGKFRDPLDLVWGLYRRFYIAFYWHARGYLPARRSEKPKGGSLFPGWRIMCRRANVGRRFAFPTYY